jgi:hypothetical protein
MLNVGINAGISGNGHDFSSRRVSRTPHGDSGP